MSNQNKKNKQASIASFFSKPTQPEPTLPPEPTSSQFEASSQPAVTSSILVDSACGPQSVLPQLGDLEICCKCQTSFSSSFLRRTFVQVSILPFKLIQLLQITSTRKETSRYNPLFVFQKKGNPARSFSTRWYSEYSWIEYSKAKDAAFCFYCRHDDTACHQQGFKFTISTVNSQIFTG